MTLYDDRGPKSREEAVSRKNEFLALSLSELPEMSHQGHTIAKRVIDSSNEFSVLLLGIQKDIERVTRELTPERLESYPTVILALNNQPDVQIIGISRNTKAFSSTAVVTRVLERALNKLLQNFALAVHFEALFDESEFWDLIQEHRTKVQSVRFELITPNMANISDTLEVDLVALNKASNSHQTDLELNSPPEGALEIDRENSTIVSLVNYASKGGGDISLKIRGLKKRVRTSQSTKTTEVEELNLEGDPNLIRDILRGAINVE